MLTNKSTTNVSISGLSYDNLLKDLYNAIQDDSTLKESFTDFTSNSAERLIAEMYAYVAQQLANRIDQVGNELFVDTASKEGLTRLLKLVGYKVEFPACASLDATATVDLNTTETMQLSNGIRKDPTVTVYEDEELSPKDNDFLVVKSNSGTNYELIKYDEDTQKFDYLKDFNFEAPSTDFTLHQGVTNYKVLTINTVNRIVVNLEKSPIVKDSVRIYYKKAVQQANGSYAFEEMNKVDNFFTTSALTNSSTGNFVERNTGNGVCEITIQPWKDSDDETLNDLDKEIVIMYRVGGGAAGNINIGNLNTSINKYFQNGNVQAAIKFYNTTAGVGGKDEVTDDYIRDTVINEVRNSKLAVTDEDYEYLFPKNDTDIGFIKAYGEKDIASESLASTYGYYVNPINVWLLILKHNETLSQAYSDELENLTDYINDICFQTLDLNNRFNEKYQINNASLNHYISATELATLKDDYYYNITLTEDERKTLSNGGAKIAVTYTPYSPTADTQGIDAFNTDEYIFKPKDNCEGEQYVIQEDDGTLTTFTPVLYNEDEALRATLGTTTNLSGSFTLNGNDIEINNTGSSQTLQNIVDTINASYSGASYVVTLKQNITNTTDEVNTSFTANNTGFVLTTSDDSKTYEIKNPNSLTYALLRDSMETAMTTEPLSDIVIKPILYHDTTNGCYELLIVANKSFTFAEREADYTDSTSKYGFYNFYLENNTTASTIYSTSATLSKSKSDWPGEVETDICEADGNDLVFLFDDSSDTLEITTTDLSIKKAFDIDNEFVARKQKKISCSYTLNPSNAILTIALSSYKEDLEDGIYINIFGKFNNTITLGDYYANLEDYEPNLDGTLKTLLTRSPLKKLYSTKYMVGTNGANTIDQYGSDYQVKFSTQKIGGKTFYQINNNDAPAEVSSLCTNETLVKDYGDEKLYIRVNNEKYDEEEKTIYVYDAKKSTTVDFIVSSENHYACFDVEDFTGRRAVLLFDAILELFYDKLESNSDYDNGYLGFKTKTSDYLSCIDFGDTDPEILSDLFNITNSVVSSSEGQITPTQMKATYFNLSTYDGTFAVNEELIFKVNNYDEVTVQTGANLSEFRTNIENTTVGGVYSLSNFITVENNKIVFIDFEDGATIELKAKFTTNAQKNKILKMFDMDTFDEYSGTAYTPEWESRIAIDSNNFVDQTLTIYPSKSTSEEVEFELQEDETIDEFAERFTEEIKTLDITHTLKNTSASEQTVIVPFDEYRSYKPFNSIDKMFDTDDWSKTYSTIHHNITHTDDTETSKQPLTSLWAVGMSLYTKGQALTGVLDYDDSEEAAANRKSNGWRAACYYNNNKNVLFISQNGCIMIGSVNEADNTITIIENGETGVNASLVGNGAITSLTYSGIVDGKYAFRATMYSNKKYALIYVSADNTITINTDILTFEDFDKCISVSDTIDSEETDNLIYLTEEGVVYTNETRCPKGKISTDAKNYTWTSMTTHFDTYVDTDSATNKYIKIHAISSAGIYYYSYSYSEKTGETKTYKYDWKQGPSLASVIDENFPTTVQEWISIVNDTNKNIFAISRRGVVAKLNNTDTDPQNWVWERIAVINNIYSTNKISAKDFNYVDFQSAIYGSNDDRFITFLTLDGYIGCIKNYDAQNITYYSDQFNAVGTDGIVVGTMDSPKSITKYVNNTKDSLDYVDTVQTFSSYRLKGANGAFIKSAYNVVKQSPAEGKTTTAKIKFFPTTDVTAEENLYNDADNSTLMCDLSDERYSKVNSMADYANYFNDSLSSERHITMKIQTSTSADGMLEWGYQLDIFDDDFYLGFMFSDEDTMNSWYNPTGKSDHGMFKFSGTVFKKYEVGEYYKKIASKSEEQLLGFADNLDIYIGKNQASVNPNDFTKVSTSRDWASFEKSLSNLDEDSSFVISHFIDNISGDGIATFNNLNGYVDISNLKNYDSDNLNGKTINYVYQKSGVIEKTGQFVAGEDFASFQKNLQDSLDELEDSMYFTYSGTIYTVSGASRTIMGRTVGPISSTLIFEFNSVADRKKLFPTTTGEETTVTISPGATLKYVAIPDASNNFSVSCTLSIPISAGTTITDTISIGKDDVKDVISFAKCLDNLTVTYNISGETVTIVPSKYTIIGVKDDINIDITTDEGVLRIFKMLSTRQAENTYTAMLNLIDGKYMSSSETTEDLVTSTWDSSTCDFKLKLNYDNSDESSEKGLEAIKNMFPSFDQDFLVTFDGSGYLLASRTNSGVYYIEYDKDKQSYTLNVLDKTAFPYGDIYFHMVEDYTSDHVVSTDTNNVKTYTDEYIWNNMLSDKKMMFVEHLFKQPRFVTFDLSVLVKISVLSGLNKQEEYKEKVYNYLKEAYDIYNGPISADLSTTYLRGQICSIDSQIVDASIEYLGTDMTDESTNIANTSDNLVTDFNQKLILSSQKTNGDVILHGLNVTVEYDV